MIKNLEMDPGRWSMGNLKLSSVQIAIGMKMTRFEITHHLRRTLYPLLIYYALIYSLDR